MPLKPGDRVARKGDRTYQGTVRRVSKALGTRRLAAFVDWDNGTLTDVWQKDIVAIEDPRAELITAAFDWLTDDRDPSTRDLLVLEGLRVATWIDTDEEVREIVRKTVIGYGHLDDMRAFLAQHGLDKEQS